MARDIRVIDINRSVVQAWVTWVDRKRMKNGEPYAHDTRTGWWRLLSQVLKDAAADYDLPDPTFRVDPPSRKIGKLPVREQSVLTEDEVAAFLAAVQTYHPSHYTAILTVALTGLRPGEVYGLKWDCIDLDKGCITVKRTVSGRELSETTKTHDPRTTAIDPILADALREHRKVMMRDQHPGLQENWVFPSADGKMRLPQSVRKVYDFARDAAHIDQRVTPQVFRRGVNTALLDAGVDRIVQRAMMGHCSEEMTARYAGIDLSRKKAAMERIFPHLREKLRS